MHQFTGLGNDGGLFNGLQAIEFALLLINEVFLDTPKEGEPDREEGGSPGKQGEGKGEKKGKGCFSSRAWSWGKARTSWEANDLSSARDSTIVMSSEASAQCTSNMPYSFVNAWD